MTIAFISVWRQQEDLLIPRMEALPMAELERLKELLSEYSHASSHDEECELAPHAGGLFPSHLSMTRRARATGQFRFESRRVPALTKEGS
jgi:hypothetical protein